MGGAVPSEQHRKRNIYAVQSGQHRNESYYARHIPQGICALEGIEGELIPLRPIN